MLPSLQKYVLCSQDFPALAVYQRSADWKVERFAAGDVVKLDPAGTALSGDELYGYLGR